MYGEDIAVREVAGGHVGWNTPEVSLSDLEERLAAVRESWADVEASLTRVEEAQAADARARERRYREWLHGRAAVGPEVGRAIGDAIFGQSTPVRESVHPVSSEPGALPARESNTNPWIAAMEGVFDGARTRPMTWQDALAIQRLEEAAREQRPVPTKQAVAEGEQLLAGFERACLHGGLGPAAR
jgi:hypothetical protein